ncbi:hypothetical protein GCM10008904_15240 [Paraclostridium ghonii]|uniref:Uncharacterized protein n=1 Tax=Paraclostridium ghonii TaxID=29358 RepID=A0ABU0N0G7_9FIRM|nr:hypothetical protein [Paeniclostridium ghonii]MDQ0556358.1 hypothetical protein [Paeniclostridium ghonii]
MKSLDMKKNPKITRILYGCAAVMALLIIFNISAVTSQIADAMSKGAKISGQLGVVIGLYVNTVTPYVFYTIALFSLGYIIKKLEDLKVYQNIDMEKSESIRTNQRKNARLHIEKEDEYDEIDDLLKDL